MAVPAIVFVDEHPLPLRALCELLRSRGMEVLQFVDFESARHYLCGNAPAALVSDLRLGAFNGLHLVLLAKRWSPGIPAFVYSTADDWALRDEADRCGAVFVNEEDILEVLLPGVLQALAPAAGAVAGTASADPSS